MSGDEVLEMRPVDNAVVRARVRQIVVLHLEHAHLPRCPYLYCLDLGPAPPIHLSFSVCSPTHGH
eukprot:764079-Hanusia_phi.AAC.14